MAPRAEPPRGYPKVLPGLSTSGGYYWATCPRAGGVFGSRLWLIGQLIVVAFLLSGQIGSAQDDVHYAGLVIRDQEGELTYAYVAFTEPEISGIELLKRSGVPLVTVSFGGLGEAVCSIHNDGCSVPECQRRLCQGPRVDDPFWQSFRQQSPGDWRPQLLGASSARVTDGDINGWSWTSDEANLPALTLDEIAARAATAGAAAPEPEPIVINWPVYAGAGVILAAIGGGAVVLSHRRAAQGRVQ